MAYKDLVIQLSRSQENEHQFIASALEAGKPVASNSFELRLDELRIMHHLLELENEAVNTKSRVTFHRDFGQELFKTVFAGELGDYFKKHLLGNGDGLRIGLQFDESASLLVKLPWEFLHDGEDFLVARRNTLLSRLPSSQKRIKSPPIESVLRMLVIISSPVDSNCAPLNTEKERDRILRAVDKLHASGKIVVDFTDIATIETIQSYLNENDYHIVHFSGHGGCTDGCSYLVLENEDLSAWVVDNQTISDLFAGRGIRLMVLSSCKCADLDLANKLARKGVPAVVSFQYSILDESASRFAEVFYSALTSGNPVDLSMTEARIAMRNAEGSNKLDFATPVLYLLDPDCLRIGKIVPDTFDLFQKPFMLGNLEAMIDGFVGRQKELIALQKVLLSSIKRAAVVYGLGGIGKTVLATRLALRMDRHFEGFFGHRCNPQTRAEDILIGLTSFLNMAGIDSLNQLMSSQAPISVKTATLVRILNQRRLLIILDNMESCLDEGGKQIADPELRDFVSALLSATVAGSKFIVTSRIDFDPLEGRLVSAVEHYHLPEMPYYEAIWLMNNHTSLAKLDFQKKKQIHKAVGGHPWSLDHFALQVSEGAEVDDLLERLEPLEKEAKAFTLFDHAHSQLDGEAKELLLRASIFEEAAPEEALRWMMGDDNTPSPSVSKPLRELLRLGLAVRQEEREIRLYSVHTLVRKFVQQEAKDKGIDLRPLLIRAAQHYEMQVKVNQNLWDLLRARDYYYRAEEYERAADIVEAAIQYLARWGYVELAMSLSQQSANTTSGAKKAIATVNLAILYRGVGDLKNAIRLLEEAEAVLNEQGDRRNVAAILHQLGNVHYQQGNYSEAVKLYEQSLDLAKDLGDKSGIASSLHQLGMVHQDQGNYSEAVKLYEQSLDIKKDLGDKSGIASSLHQLGNVHYQQGNYSEAVKLYVQSLDIKKDLGDKSGIASSLHQLGNVHYQQGNYSEAVKLYEQSLDIKKDLGDKSGIASSLHQLGNVHYQQGNYSEAVKLYEQSLEMAKDLGDKSGIASSLHQLGNVHYQQGNYSEAVKLYEQSLDIKEDLGDKSGIASSLHQLGNVHYQQGNYSEAVKLYEQSLDLAKDLGDKSGIAISHHQLGKIKEERKNFEGALKDYLTALSILEELHSPSSMIVKSSIAKLRSEIGEKLFKNILLDRYCKLK